MPGRLATEAQAVQAKKAVSWRISPESADVVHQKPAVDPGLPEVIVPFDDLVPVGCRFGECQEEGILLGTIAVFLQEGAISAVTAAASTGLSCDKGRP